MKFSFNVEDASQVFVGAFALAVLFLSLFTYQSVFQKDIRSRIIIKNNGPKEGFFGAVIDSDDVLSKHQNIHIRI